MLGRLLARGHCSAAKAVAIAMVAVVGTMAGCVRMPEDDASNAPHDAELAPSPEVEAVGTFPLRFRASDRPSLFNDSVESVPFALIDAGDVFTFPRGKGEILLDNITPAVVHLAKGPGPFSPDSIAWVLVNQGECNVTILSGDFRAEAPPRFPMNGWITPHTPYADFHLQPPCGGRVTLMWRSS